MAPRKNARVAIYARVSTTGQDAGMQVRELREYAHQRGLEVVDELVDTESGSKDRRPQLDRLWTLVRGRKVDTVLVYRFDRFARSTKQLVDALEEFNHLGVDFISLHEQIDTSSPMGKAMFTIISAISEFEREIIRERVRSGLARAKADGKKLGRPRVPEKTENQNSPTGQRDEFGCNLEATERSEGDGPKIRLRLLPGLPLIVQLKVHRL